jgi:membrane fusion protein, multidrug efflux system
MDTRIEQPKPATLQRPRRRSLLGSMIAVLALLVLGGLAWYLTHQSNSTSGPRAGSAATPGAPGGRGAPATTVGVAAAERADIPVTLEALGTVTAGATATVRPQVSGVLQKVMFREGELVKAGQLLAVIDPRQFEMQLMQATGQRQRDEAQLDNARVALDRYRTLLAQDSIARQDVDTQAALVKQLEGTVTTDRAAEGTARLNLGYSKVAAPIGGRVGLRVVDVGNVVGPNDTNGIAVITQVSPIDVEFAIPQDQVQEVRARVNEGAALPVAALDRTRAVTLDSGNFLALDNQVDPQTGTVKAKARFANASLGLFPSQFVNVRLLLRTIQGAVVVPVTALRHGSNGDFVYVLNAAEHTVALRPVKRGQGTVDKVEITSGLTAGEQVITEGADRLKDGARVTLPGERPAAGGARRQGGAAAASGAGASVPAEQKRRRSSETTAP